MPDEVALRMAREFQALSSYLSESGADRDRLQRLVDLAVALVPGCSWAGVSEHQRGRPPRSLAVSDGIAALVDELQYAVGQGPCLEAAADEESDVVSSPDLEREPRWPHFCKRALAESPVRSVLSIGLSPGPPRTALNLYGAVPDAFDSASVATCALFAAHAHLLLAQLRAEEKVAHLTEALGSSRTIATAVGVVMTVHKMTSEQAFDLLRRTSQDLNIKVRDLAARVADTGEAPAHRPR